MDTQPTGPAPDGYSYCSVTDPNGTVSYILVKNPDTTPPGPLATIDDLLQIRDALLKKEADDLVAFNAVFQPDDATLKDALVHWATIGFPQNHILLSVQLNPPPKCSDGITRTFYFYALYLTKLDDMSSLFDALKLRATGMDFNFTLVDVNTINLIVSKV